MPRGVKTLIPAQEGENGRFILSLDEFATETGYSPRTIRRYVALGMPRRTDGRLYFPESYRWLILWQALPRQEYPEAQEYPQDDLPEDCEPIDFLEWPSEPGASTEEMMHEFKAETEELVQRLLRDANDLAH